MAYKVNSEFLFPSQVIISDDENYFDYKNQLINFCYSQKEKDLKGCSFTNVGGWQSNPLRLLSDGDFTFFIDKLTKNINECLDKEFLIKDNITAYINRIWINISGENNYNTTHVHPFSHYSGVFFVKSDLNCGDIIFYHPSNLIGNDDFSYRKESIIIDKNIYYKKLFNPIEGRMILFPSNVPHGVDNNKKNAERISISFDLIFSENA